MAPHDGIQTEFTYTKMEPIFFYLYYKIWKEEGEFLMNGDTVAYGMVFLFEDRACQACFDLKYDFENS